MRKLEIRTIPAELVMVGGIDAEKRVFDLPSGRKMFLFNLTGSHELSQSELFTLARQLQDTFRTEAKTILMDLPEGVGFEVHEVE